MEKQPSNGNMKNHIVKKILLLSCLQSVVGRPIRCSLTTNIVLYDPKYPEVDVECVPCPDCPEGQGLSPQCGSRIPNDSKIECKLCLVNETYSNNHGIESCKPCQECHLKNVIQHCTGSQNRICGKKCPQGSFLDDNNVCQECYFCCGNVSEAYRRQGCKDIGMDRNRQCEKTEQNQRCKRALEPTIRPTDKKNTVPHDRNHDNEKQATSIPHDTSQYPSTPTESQGIRKVATSPVNDNNSTSALSTEKEKGQKENGTTFLGVNNVSDVVLRVIVLAVVILVLVAGVLIYWKRCKSPRKEPESADNADWIELSQCEPQDLDNSTSQDSTELSLLQSNREPEDSDRSTSQDSTELSLLPSNREPEDSDRSTSQVPKPNPAVIPAEMSDVNEDVDETNATNYLGAFTNVDLKYLKLSEIPQDLEDRLVKKLDVRRKGEHRYGWQKVGAEFKIGNDDLEYLKIEYKRENGSPTSTLLSILGIRKGKTVSDLVNVLQRSKVKLADVASLIRRYIKAANNSSKRREARWLDS